ncbi:hypothetical protein B0T26DRAFT_767047, partial [Lasiosphaeria miniovina]
MAKIYAKASRGRRLARRGGRKQRRSTRVHAHFVLEPAAADEANKPAIIKLLQRPWFQRIWVLQEVAAARHIVIRCGSTEMGGHAFCSALGVLKPFYSTIPSLQGLIPPITHQVRDAIFRPKYNLIQQGAFSLSIHLLGELVDMFHTREATEALDKVYALLGMSSGDPSAEGLSADYIASWKTVFKKLIAYSLSTQASVETWDGKDVALIKGKGYVLGSVSRVEDTTQDSRVRVTWNRHSHDTKVQSFILWASAKSLQPGDFICLFQGASHPT